MQLHQLLLLLLDVSNVMVVSDKLQELSLDLIQRVLLNIKQQHVVLDTFCHQPTLFVKLADLILLPAQVQM